MVHYKYISYDQIKCTDDSKGVGGFLFGETPRYIFHYANVPYDEILINLENFTVYDSAWNHEFPILISDGQVLTNSMEISRHLAKQFESESGFLSKSGVSWIDFMVANHMWAVRKVASETMKKKYPTLLSHAERVFALPGIKDFVEKDKKRYNMNEVILEAFDLQEKCEMNGCVVDNQVHEIVLAA
uniref:glutathione transferase n=1 Tax=Acrobeloides nanus TaxID=290746 RepID=A0A914DMM9_9BILA